MNMGPYSDVQIVTVARGADEANARLASGWMLLGMTMEEEVIDTGAATRQRRSRWVPMFFLGRKIATGEDASIAREEANEASEDAVTNISLAPVESAESETDIPPLSLSPQAATIGAKRSIKKGTGEFVGTGIRG